MALQLRRGETRSFGKMIATSFAVMAFVLQPLVALDIPSAFAISSVGVSTQAELQQALNNHAADITLDGDITTTSQIEVNYSTQFTGGSLVAGFNGAGNGFDAILLVDGAATNFKAVSTVFNGNGHSGLQGVQVYNGAHAVFNGVTFKNNSKTGLHINGAIATVHNVTTSNNGAYGILVDQGSGVTTLPSLTVTGQSVQSEAAAINVDSNDASRSSFVIDDSQQYNSQAVDIDFIIHTHHLLYMLKSAPAAPTFVAPTPADGSTVHANDIAVAWTKPAYAHSVNYTVDGVTKNTIDEGIVGDTVSLNLASGTHTVTLQSQALSGLKGDSVTRTFTVDELPKLAVVTPSEGGYVSTNNWNQLTITGSFTDDHKANYATLQLVKDGVGSIAIGTLYGYGSVYNPAATYAAADGSYTFNLKVPAHLADGEYHLFYTGKDFTGGVTSRMERTFFIDNSAPTLNVTAPTASQDWQYINKSNSNGELTVTGNVDTTNSGTNQFGVDVGTYVATGNNYGSHVTGCSNLQKNGTADVFSFSCKVDLSKLTTDGQYVIRTTVQDKAGNWSAVNRYITVDITAPTGTAVYTGGNEVGGVIYLNTINDLKYSATLGDNDALNQTSYVVFKLDSNGNRTGQFCGNWHNSSSTEVLSGIAASVNNILVSKCDWYHSNGSWSDGSYEISHIVYDEAGNTTRFNTATQKFVIDSAVPAMPAGLKSTSQTGTNITNGFTNTNFVKNSWSAVPGAVKYNYEFQKPNGLPTYTTTTTNTFVQGQFHNAASPEGQYAFRVQAVSISGVVSTWSDWSNVTYDHTAPVAHITVSPLHNGSYATKTVTVTGSVDASEHNMKSHWFEITGPDNYVYHAYNMNDNSDSWSFDWNTKSLASGVYTIRYVATDKAGNRNDDPNNTNPTKTVVTVDNQGPQASFDVMPSSFINGDLALSGTASDNVKLKDVIFDIRENVNGKAGGFVKQTGCTAVSLQKVFLDDQHATISCMMSTAGLVDGTSYVLRIHASDYANYGGGQDVVFTFDTTVPTVTQSVSTTAPTNKPVTATLTFSEPVTGVDSSWKQDTTNPLVYTKVFGANATNTVSFKDLAGNSGADETVTITNIDTTAPALTVNSYTGTDTTPTLTGTTESANDFVTVAGHVATVSQTPNSNGTYNWSYTFTAPFIVGTTKVAVVSTDAVGNYTRDEGTLVVQGSAAPQNVAFTPAVNQTTGQQGDNINGQAVKGISTTKNNAGDSKSNGFAWYWWLIAAAVAAFLWWLIAAARRRKQAE